MDDRLLLAALPLVSCPRLPLVPARGGPGGLPSPPLATVAATGRPDPSAVPDRAIAGPEGGNGIIWVLQAYHLLGPRRSSGQQLLRQLEELERDWGGVLGVYVYDLAADREVVGLYQESEAMIYFAMTRLVSRRFAS